MERRHDEFLARSWKHGAPDSNDQGLDTAGNRGRDVLNDAPELVEADVAVLFRRRADANEGYIRVYDGLNVRRCRQPSGRDRPRYNSLEARLKKRSNSFEYVPHFALVAINTNHVIAHISQTSRRNAANVTKAEHRYVRIFDRCSHF